MPGAALSGAGFHGKMPALGDFVTRVLPRAVVDPWHAWLEDAVEASRTALGTGWLDAFMTCPVWRFALAPGLCGTVTLAGVMIPSVDKVGRYFPFTVAAPAVLSPAQVAGGAGAWFDAAEALALAALDIHGSADAMEERLAELPPLPGAVALTLPEPDPLFGTPAAARLLDGATDGLGLSLAGLAAGRLDAVFGPHALWWTAGSDRVAPGLLASAGLPKPAAFTALLDGDWSRWTAAAPGSGRTGGVLTDWGPDE